MKKQTKNGGNPLTDAAGVTETAKELNHNEKLIKSLDTFQVGTNREVNKLVGDAIVILEKAQRIREGRN